MALRDTGCLTVYPKKYAHGFALLCFVVVMHWLIFPYPPGLLHWHCGNLTIAPVPAKQTWWIWINTSCEFIMNDCITTTKQSTTKPCAYFLGYTVKRLLLIPLRQVMIFCTFCFSILRVFVVDCYELERQLTRSNYMIKASVKPDALFCQLRLFPVMNDKQIILIISCLWYVGQRLFVQSLNYNGQWHK